MIEVKIPQEIRQYDAKMIGPFSFRQAICGVAAIGIAYILNRFLKGVVPQDALIGLIMLVCVPLALIGWVKPYGMRFEKFFVAVLFNTLLSNPKRYFQSKNSIENIEKIEIKNMEESGKGAKKNKKQAKPKKEDIKKLQKQYRKYTYM